MELIFKKGVDFKRAYSITSEDKNFRINTISADEELFLEGSFFYQTRSGNVEKLSPETLDDQLKKSFLENKVQAFIETIEGVYAGIYIDKKNEKIIVFSDKLKRKEIYYCADANEVIVATSLKNLRGKSGGYSPESIISILYMYAPKGSTIHNNIFRLRYNETIEITGGNLKVVKHNEAPLKIRDYDERDLASFGEMVENAVISRASPTMNTVQLSGGWDSTFLLSVLHKYYERNRISAIIIATTFPDGRIFNQYELEKAEQITKFFGIDLHTINFKVGFEADWIDLWEQEVKEKALVQEIYDSTIFSHFLITRHLQDKYGENIAVFNGEGADSLNNFGFSQYISLPHNNSGFSEYADKMACYLYGPSFLTKVLNNSYKDELIFKIFQWYFKDFGFTEADRLSKEDRLFEYLMSFVYAPNRIPFVQLEQRNFVKEEGMKRFRGWLKSEYFGKIIESINPQNCYYWLLRLYTDFHWQCPRIKKTGICPNIRLPFLDYGLFRFFSQMPENWGRGLEINNTKYALKRLIREGDYQFPTEIVERGPHSYITTVTDALHQYIYDSNLPKYLLGKVDFDAKSEGYFSSDCFDLDYVKKYITDIKERKIDPISSTGFNLLNFLMLAE